MFALAGYHPPSWRNHLHRTAYRRTRQRGCCEDSGKSGEIVCGGAEADSRRAGGVAGRISRRLEKTSAWESSGAGCKAWVEEPPSVLEHTLRLLQNDEAQDRLKVDVLEYLPVVCTVNAHFDVAPPPAQ